MKKTMQLKITILLLLITVSCLANFGVVALAQDISSDDPCDVLFTNSVLQLANCDDESYQLSAKKYEIYDMDLVRLGWIYDFSYNGTKGYAIIANAFENFDVMEMSLESEFPFDVTFDGQFVYASFMSFLQYKDGTFYVAKTERALTKQEVDIIRESSYYSGGVDFTYSTEYIYCTGKNENVKKLAAIHPAVFSVTNITNGCSPIAGASLIQYWDKDKENLIPNYTSYKKVGTSIAYKSSDDTTDKVAQQLAVDMKTNVTTAGTTINGFKNGLSTYCSRQGYTASFTSCMTLGKFSYSKVKAQLDKMYPVAIFMQNYTVSQLYSSDGYDYVDNMNSNGSHTMAVFGYREITYTLTSGGSRTDNYLLVSSGFDNRPRALVNIKQASNINDAFSVIVS